MKPVKIYSIHCNRPDFIELQQASLNKFIQDKTWELIIVNNSHSEEHRTRITLEATRCSLKQINLYPQLGPGFAHAEAMNTLWQTYMYPDKDSLSVFLDGDVFLIDNFDINAFVGSDLAFAGGKQQREHVWHWFSPQCLIINPANIPDGETINWIGGTASNGCTLDTGGGLHKYWELHPEVKLNKTKEMVYTWYINAENQNRHVLPDKILPGYQDDYSIELIEDCWLHYARSSNYDNKDPGYHARKTSFVRAFIYGCINGAIQAKKTRFIIPNDTYFGWGFRK